MMGITSMRRMFEGREGGKKKRIAIDSENCRDRWEHGARIPRLYKNTKTFYKPESYPCTNVSRYKGEKDGECRKREWTIAESECMGG
jgi:hypothetical protein